MYADTRTHALRVHVYPKGHPKGGINFQACKHALVPLFSDHCTRPLKLNRHALYACAQILDNKGCSLSLKMIATYCAYLNSAIQERGVQRVR